MTKHTEESFAVAEKSLAERLDIKEGRFKIVKVNPEMGELTEKELEELCDPTPDATGICKGIITKIGLANDLDKGALVEAMLEGRTSDGVTEGMELRKRIGDAVDNMIRCGFLKVIAENGSVESNIDLK